jgi:hypothetical protein
MFKLRMRRIGIPSNSSLSIPKPNQMQSGLQISPARLLRFPWSSVLTASLTSIKRSKPLITNATADNNSAWGYDSLPFLQVGLYDPEIPFSLDEFAWNCGSPPFYYTVNTEITTTTQVELAVQRTLFFDSAKVLPDHISDPGELRICSNKDLNRRKYIYYNAQPNMFTLGPSSLANSSCDRAGANYNNDTPCSLVLSVQIRSEILTTQTSSHGTTALHILIDEGGILGGILFFTWFFGIFVV